MHYNTVLITFSLLLCLLSCKSDASFSTTYPTNIVKTNKVRESLGIRQIDEQNWDFYGTAEFPTDETSMESLEETWMYKGFQAKKIVYSSTADGRKTIEWEEDYFYSGRKYKPNDPDCEIAWEMMIVHYDYKTKHLYVSYLGPLTKIENEIEKRGYFHVSGGAQNYPDFDEVQDFANDTLTSMGLSSETYP